MASPASPRLPSPPPIPEDQLSPGPTSAEQQKLFSNLDHAAARRIRPGTKAEDMAEGPPLVDLAEIDSAFQLTEHLKALHNFLTHPIGANGVIAVDRDMAMKLADAPENVDRTLWLYELCRFLTQKANSIIIALFSDSPACSSTTCPEMRASEWQYLCAVHDPPKSCCAIDYCCHTLDWAANTLTSPKHFPSRLALGTDQPTQHSQMRHLTNIFRRVYRIFAHAWFQHRDMFWKVEGRTGLYIFFKTVCDVYGLIPEDNYTIPPEAEGIEPSPESRPPSQPFVLTRDSFDPPQYDSDSTLVEGMTGLALSTAGTTKRHRTSPSMGATSVTTVVEENEEEEERPQLVARPVTQIFDSAPEEEDDITVLERPDAADDEPDVAEKTSLLETTQIADPSQKESAGEVHDGTDPELEHEKNQSEASVTAQPPAETTESRVSDTKTKGQEAPLKSLNTTEEHKAVEMESETAEISQPIAKSLARMDEDEILGN